MDQLEYVDAQIAKDRRGRIENPPGLYVHYIRDNIAPPAYFWSSRKAKLHEQAQRAKNTELERRAQLEIAYEEYRDAEIKRFADTLPRDEYQQLFDQQRRLNKGAFKSMTNEQLDELTQTTVRAALENSRVHFISFEDFAATAPIPHAETPITPSNQ